MTALDTPATWRLRLNARWRAIFAVDAAAAADVLSPEPEEAPVGHIYPSSNAEPGQTTTAVGRHHTAEHQVIAPRNPGERTQVIRVPRRNELGQELKKPVEAEAYDPPIYLRTLAEVQRLRALPPAAGATDQPAKEGDTDE